MLIAGERTYVVDWPHAAVGATRGQRAAVRGKVERERRHREIDDALEGSRCRVEDTEVGVRRADGDASPSGRHGHRRDLGQARRRQRPRERAVRLPEAHLPVRAGARKERAVDRGRGFRERRSRPGGQPRARSRVEEHGSTGAAGGD